MLRTLKIKIRETIYFCLMSLLIYLNSKESSSQDPDPLDPQDFSFVDPDPDPQKYADPRIRIQVTKYQPKTAKKKITPKTQI